MALNLKIEFPETKASKYFPFSQDQLVKECISAIKAKMSLEGEFALFQPAVMGKTNARWFEEDRTLAFYDVTNESQLRFMKKVMPVKVRLMDETVKMFVIDVSLPVESVVAFIGGKLSIANPEEYSLQAESKTGWLNPKKSINEGGVDMVVNSAGKEELPIIVLKKKFHYSDGIIDRSDPVQLNLLYVESRDAIVKGEMPCSKEEAVKLAGLQCQIELQDFNPSRHKPGIIDPKKYASPSVNKKILKPKLEKMILQEFSTHVGMAEQNAKVKYIQICRGLKTYGMTTFNVFYLPKGKKKLAPLILGITRDSIITMMPDDREIVNQWPLTHLRSWAAAKDSFTFDFGDYELDYVTYQTYEGEDISQIINGYINIILTKKREATVTKEDDGADVAVIEDVGPIKGIAATTKLTTIAGGDWSAGTGTPAMLQPGMRGFGVGAGKGMPGVTDLSSALQAAQKLLGDLQSPTAMGPPAGAALSSTQYKTSLAAAAKAVSEAVGKLLGEAAKAVPDKGMMNGVSMNLMSDIKKLVDAARGAAAANDEDISLLDGAKMVSEAVAKVLQCSKLLSENPNDPKAKQMLREAQDAMRQAQTFLNAAQKGVLADSASQQLMIESAKALATASSTLIRAATDAAKGLPDPKAALMKIQPVHINNAKMLSTATSMAPAIGSESVKKQVLAAGDTLLESTTGLVSDFLARPIDAAAKANIERAQAQIIEATETMKAAISSAQMARINGHELSTTARELKKQTGLLKQNPTNAAVIASGVRKIGPAANKLVSASKAVAMGAPEEVKAKLLEVAKFVAGTTGNLVKVAKASRKAPEDPVNAAALKEAASKLEAATDTLVAQAGKRAALLTLQYEAKNAAAAATALISNAKANSKLIPDRAQQTKLIKATAVSNKVASDLIKDVAVSMENPYDDEFTEALLKSALAFKQPAAELAATIKQGAVSVTDPTKKKEFNDDADRLRKAIATLDDATLAFTGTDDAPEIKEAVEQFQALASDLEALKAQAEKGALPKDGSSLDAAIELLDTQNKELKKCNVAMVQIAKKNPDKIGPMANKLVKTVGAVVSATRGVAGLTPDKEGQKRLITAVQELAAAEEAAIRTARDVSADGKDAAKAKRLDEEIEAANSIIDRINNTARGADAFEIDNALAAVKASAGKFDKSNALPGVDHQEAISDLNSASKAVLASAEQVASMAKTNPKGIATAAKMVASSLPGFISAVNDAAGSAPTAAIGDAIIADGKKTAAAAAALLEMAKLASTKKDKGSLNDLISAAKGVTDAMTILLTTASPGRKEANEAIGAINDALHALYNSSPSSIKPENAIRELNEAVKQLASSTGQILAAARRHPEKLGEHSQVAAQKVVLLINASKAATMGGRVAVPQQATIEKQANQIREFAQSIRNDPGTKATVLTATKGIAQNTASLAELLKAAAAAASSAELKASILKAGQGIVVSSNALTGAVKELATDQPDAEKKVQSAAKALTAASAIVLVAINSPSTDREIALLDATKGAGKAATTLINASVALSQNSSDRELQTGISTAGSGVTESIKKLLKAVADMSPGIEDCDTAAESVTQAQDSLESALISASVGTLENSTRPGKNFQECQEEMVSHSREIAAAITNIVNGVRNNSPELGDGARKLKKVITVFVEASLGGASTAKDKETMTNMLNSSKALTESLHALLLVSKKAMINPEVKNEVLLKSKEVSTLLSKVVSGIKDSVVMVREVDEAVASVANSVKVVAAPVTGAAAPYKDSKAKVTSQSTVLARNIAKMLTSAKNADAEVGPSSKAVAETLALLVEAARHASAGTTIAEVKPKIATAIKSVVDITDKLIKATRVVAADPKNEAAKKSLQISALQNCVAELRTAVASGALGEIELSKAIQALNKTVADLDGSSLMAAAGQLDIKDIPKEADFATSDKDLQNAAKMLAAAAAKVPVASSTSDEELAKAAKSVAVSTIGLSKKAKLTAFFIPDIDTQQELLTAAKAAASSATELIMLAREEQENPDVKEEVAKASKDVSENVSKIIVLSQTAVAEAAKGVVQLQRAKASINKTVADAIAPTFKGKEGATAVELCTSCRDVASALGLLGNAVTLANQDELVVATDKIAKAISSLMQNAKGASALTTDVKIKQGILDTAKAAASRVIALIDSILLQGKTRHSVAAQRDVATNTEELAAEIQRVVEMLNKLPGGEGLTLEDSKETDKLEDMAHNELLAAAKAIEAASSMLLARKPDVVKGANLKLDIHGVSAIIMECAISVSQSTSGLVRAAAASQSERIKQGRDAKTAKNRYRADPVWANGLISAARNVAVTIQRLVKIASESAEGKLDSAPLVASARSVAQATAHLVAACRAKADPSSRTLEQLSDASKDVGTTTKNLVQKAKDAITDFEASKEEEALKKKVSLSEAQKVALKMEEEEEIAKLEESLRRKRRELAARNKARYNDKPSA